MSLHALRGGIISAIQKHLPQLRDCSAHPGLLSVDDLRRLSLHAPSVRVACLNVPRLERQGPVTVVHARWAVYVVVRGGSTEPRDEGALALVTKLCRLVQSNRFGVTGAHTPRGEVADNLYSAALDGIGVALWALTWEQGVDVTDFNDADLGEFKKFFGEWDLGKTAGTPVEGNLVLPEGEQK